MPTQLTSQKINEVAWKYSIEPAVLHALADVESAGSGFLPDGRVKILLERHWVYKLLKNDRKLDPRPLAVALPSVCGPSWNPQRYPYGSSASQYDRIGKIITWAQEHDPERWETYKKVAYEASSWGRFQLMGLHYKRCGYPDIYAMKHSFEADEGEHLAAACRWMRSNGLLGRLQARDWEAFVRGYNGPSQINYYMKRLLAAYAKHRKNGEP
jgi:hypothetical protein